MAATQAKPAPAAAPSRPRRRCWRCPTIRRPISATQLRLGRGAVAMVVATGRRLQVAACASASVHQARRPSRRDFRLRIVLPCRPGPICGLPGRPPGPVGRGLRWSSLVVGVWAETRLFLWKYSKVDITWPGPPRPSPPAHLLLRTQNAPQFARTSMPARLFELGGDSRRAAHALPTTAFVE